MIDGRDETDFVKDILVKLSESGRYLVWRNNSGMAFMGKRGTISVGTAGMSDILGVTLDGKARFLSFEIKSDTAPWQKGQKPWLERVAGIGGIATAYRYRNKLTWEENVDAALAELDRAAHGNANRSEL